MPTRSNRSAIEWKDVAGYEGRYRIGSNGDVLSLRAGEIMHQGTNNSGYRTVKLRKGGEQHTFTVHRLVAQSFIENDSPKVKTEVDHIDGDKCNNDVSNLEWVTHSENVTRALNLGLYDEARQKQSEMMKLRAPKISSEAHRKGLYDFQKVPVYRSDGVMFESIAAAAAATGCSIQHISNVVNDNSGKTTANGYLFWKVGDMPRNNKSARVAGSRFERQVADYLSTSLGDEDIDRQVKVGRNDVGDVRGVKFHGDRFIIECKNQKKLALGTWMNEAEVEAGNADTQLFCVVHKRRGTQDPTQQYVTMTLGTFAAMLAGGPDLLFEDREDR